MEGQNEPGPTMQASFAKFVRSSLVLVVERKIELTFKSDALIKYNGLYKLHSVERKNCLKFVSDSGVSRRSRARWYSSGLRPYLRQVRDLWRYELSFMKHSVICRYTVFPSSEVSPRNFSLRFLGAWIHNVQIFGGEKNLIILSLYFTPVALQPVLNG